MSTDFSMVRLIEKTKLGQELSAPELGWLCRMYAEGGIPDYQVAAWLMAVRLKGLTSGEIDALTEALVATGKRLEWPSDRPVVDKHSTGGVGDKTSIVLVPLLAAAGVAFVKMSGRGLGHTGGTLDKLESIPGFNVNLTLDRIRDQVQRIGCAMVGQSPELVPGDAALYALRDVTSTVDSLPLIASSIMSKKLAAGASALILDVKFGSGAFLQGAAEAEALATEMVRIGTTAGRRVKALLTPMHEVLGVAVGNALEVREAIAVLRGEGPADLRRLTLDLGAHLMVLAGTTPALEDARVDLEKLLDSGDGLTKLAELIDAQDGDPRVVDHPTRLPSADRVIQFPSDRSGWVEAFDARGVAEAALEVGAGRRIKGGAIDPAVGIRVLARVGDRVERGQPLAELHLGSTSEQDAALQTLRRAVRIGSEMPSADGSEMRVIEPGSGTV